MAVETNARIEFSVASVEEWEKVNPKLHQGEPVFAKKPNGKYILKVGAPGGSAYKNAVVVWDQDDAETKMENTQTAAAEALASKNAAAASAANAKTSETAAAGSKSAAATSAANAKTSETNAAASKTAAANSASTASAKATAAGNSASAAATSEKNAGSSASAAATSESNALKSANAAITSASNAKTSETNADASAKAAKQSEENAKTWDPTQYAKIDQTVITTGDAFVLDNKDYVDINDARLLKKSSIICIYNSTTSKIANLPEPNNNRSFFLFNFKDIKSTDDIAGRWMGCAQFFIYLSPPIHIFYRRVSGTPSQTKPTFFAWKQIVDTDITDALANKIPKQYVQSVTESNGKVTVTKGGGESTTFNAGLNILARNKAYAVGDIAYSPNLPSYLYLECTIAGTTGATEPDMSTVSGGDG